VGIGWLVALAAGGLFAQPGRSLDLQLVVDPDVKPGTNLDHAALGIVNIEEVCKRLDDAGYIAATPLTETQPDDQGARHLKMAFYHDPEGNKVELLVYLD
jgi:catechol 2,3-dioxygenase-like lactoylglutathione lyase family enzyme